MDTSACKRAIILLGHGSRGTREVRPFSGIRGWMERASGLPCRDAYLSLCPPTLAETVNSLVAEGMTDCDILPLFLVDGRHVLKDLPLILEETVRRHPGLRFRLAPTLAADAAVTDLLQRRLGQAAAWVAEPPPVVGEAGPVVAFSC